MHRMDIEYTDIAHPIYIYISVYIDGELQAATQYAVEQAIWSRIAWDGLHPPALCLSGFIGSEKHLEGGPGPMLSCPAAGRASGVALWVLLPKKPVQDGVMKHSCSSALWSSSHHEHCRRAEYSHSCSTPSFSCLTEQCSIFLHNNTSSDSA